jgi:hypothetical protein
VAARLNAVVIVGEEVFQRAKQKRAKASALPGHGAQSFLRQQVIKKGLKQILCVVVRLSLPPNVGVKGTLIRSEKVLKRRAGGRTVRPLRRQHDAPVSRGEPGCVAGPLITMFSFGGHSA